METLAAMCTAVVINHGTSGLVVISAYCELISKRKQANPSLQPKHEARYQKPELEIKSLRAI